MTPPATCKFDEHRNGHPCGRRLIGGLFCPIHDRIECTATINHPGGPRKCGYRLINGTATKCPRCGQSVRLSDVLRGQR